MRRFLRNKAGFTLSEAIASLAIVGITVVPISASIAVLAQTTAGRKTGLSITDHLEQKLEEISAMEFADVTLSDPAGSASSLSDSISVDNNCVQRTVIVGLLDGDGDSTLDSDLKLVTVKILGQEMKTVLVDL